MSENRFSFIKMYESPDRRKILNGSRAAASKKDFIWARSVFGFVDFIDCPPDYGFGYRRFCTDY